MRDYILDKIDVVKAVLEDAKSSGDSITAAYYEGQIYAFELVLFNL